MAPLTRLFLLLALVSLACGQMVAFQPTTPTLPAKTQQEAPTAISTAFLTYGTPAFVTAESLFLRSCAGTDCAPLDVLYRGDQVQITGGLRVSRSLECRYWYPVLVNDTKGYVCEKWLEAQ